MSDLKTLTLKTPVQFDDERIETLTFKPLLARHLRKVSAKPTFDDLLNLVGDSTGKNLSVINLMTASDAMAAVGIVSDFLTDGQETGDQ